MHMDMAYGNIQAYGNMNIEYACTGRVSKKNKSAPLELTLCNGPFFGRIGAY